MISTINRLLKAGLTKGSFTIINIYESVESMLGGRGYGTTVRFPFENQHLYLITDYVL